MKDIRIIKMTMEEYLATYKEEYESGEVWDYPLEELEYVIENSECKKVALIENRLYEIK